MALKDLLAQMKGQVPEGTKKKEEDLMDKGLPSDEELQDSISRRRKSADEVTDYLSQKGYPTLGAVAGTVTDLSADLIPKTREEYGESLVGGGTVGKIAGKMPKPASGKAWLDSLERIETPQIHAVTEGAKKSANNALPKASKLKAAEPQIPKWKQADVATHQDLMKLKNQQEELDAARRAIAERNSKKK